jgi:branched-chain amino acid transport system ATP-binding protein
MVLIKNLHAYYGDSHNHSHSRSHIVQGVNMHLARGEIVSVLGRNGAGRSTLLKSLMGLVQGSGSVQKNGVELIGLAPHSIAGLGMGYVPEHRDVFASLTVQQNLLLGIKPKTHTPALQSAWTYAWTYEAVYDLFPALKARQRMLAGALSGGEQQMLALGRTLMGNPDTLLIDEPTEGLAPQLIHEVAHCLQQLKQRGMAILLIYRSPLKNRLPPCRR